MSRFFRISSLRFNWLITILVIAAWVYLMSFIVRDHYVPAVVEEAENFALSAAETDDWFLIRIRGAYAGFGRSRQFRKGDNWLLRDDLHLSLNLQGRLKPIRISNRAVVDNNFRLISFSLKVGSGIVSFEQSGRMEGRDLILKIPEFQGGGTRRVKLARAPRMSRSLGLPVPLTGLQEGQEIKVPVFDPLDGHKWDATIKVYERARIPIGGKQVEAWRVRGYFRSVDVTMWIDDEGRLLKGIMPLGITAVRADKEEIASQLQGVRDLPDMMTLSAVPVEGSIGDPRELKSLKLELLKGADLPIVSGDGRQKLVGNKLTVHTETIPESTYTLPNKDPSMERYLMSSRFIRSDSEAVLRIAKQVVGDETDPVKAARLINQWVFKTLKKVPTPAVPDALTVLQTKQGDCNEHAVLAVSLARALGLPSEIVLGLVYMEDGFYYHAWTRYWTGKGWVTADPLIEQLPVDATHIALMHGDVDKHVNVLSYLGKLSFKVLAESDSETK